jgi:hypothetical protein
MNSMSMNSTGLDSTSQSTLPRRRSRWTDMLLTTCGLFVMTVFLMLTTALNPNGGLLGRFFDQHGVLMLGIEVVAILVAAIIVLFVERRASRRRLAEQEAELLASARAAAGEHSVALAGEGPPSGPAADHVSEPYSTPPFEQS